MTFANLDVRDLHDSLLEHSLVSLCVGNVLKSTGCRFERVMPERKAWLIRTPHKQEQREGVLHDAKEGSRTHYHNLTLQQRR